MCYKTKLVRLLVALYKNVWRHFLFRPSPFSPVMKLTELAFVHFLFSSLFWIPRHVLRTKNLVVLSNPASAYPWLAKKAAVGEAWTVHNSIPCSLHNSQYAPWFHRGMLFSLNAFFVAVGKELYDTHSVLPTRLWRVVYVLPIAPTETPAARFLARREGLVSGHFFPSRRW